MTLPLPKVVAPMTVARSLSIMAPVNSSLALALKGVSQAVREKITRNLSSRAAEGLVEEIDLLPFKVSRRMLDRLRGERSRTKAAGVA